MIPNTDQIHKALRLAAWAHHGQITKFGDPYISHPVAAGFELVAAQSAGEVFDIDLAVVCAILHDVVEKSDVTVKMIKKDFGKRVASGVAAMTKNPGLPKKEQLRDSLIRILDESREVAMAKMADRISSMLPPPAEWSQDRIGRLLENAVMIRQMLGGASEYLAARLDGCIDRYAASLEKSA